MTIHYPGANENGLYAGPGVTSYRDERDPVDELHALASASDDLRGEAEALGMHKTARECFAIGRQLRAAVSNMGEHTTDVGRAYIEASAERLADIAARIGACAHAHA